MLAEPDGPERATVAVDRAHPANLGRLCSKGTALGETLSLYGRLLHLSMDGARTSWDAALDRVASVCADTIARHGPDSVALYVSGHLLTEDYYAANKLAEGLLGIASAVAAHRRAFDEDLVPGTYEDLELADLVVLVGSNLAWCHPVLHQRVAAARAERPGTRVVVIDPRRTATCEGADAAMAHATDVETAAASCALPTAEVAQSFRWFADTPRVVTLFSQGVNQSFAGTDEANAIINAHLFTRRISQPGARPFSITGQPNATDGWEVGARCHMLAAHLDWDRPGDAELVLRYWAAQALAQRPGLKAVDLFERSTTAGCAPCGSWAPTRPCSCRTATGCAGRSPPASWSWCPIPWPRATRSTSRRSGCPRLPGARRAAR